MRNASVVLGKDGRGGLEVTRRRTGKYEYTAGGGLEIIVVLSSSHECRLYGVHILNVQ